MMNTPAQYNDVLWKISQLPTESALPRAARYLTDLVADPNFLASNVFPLLDEASGAEDWYVSSSHEGGDDAYSLKVFVWPEGTGTRIHDHSSWGAYACAAGSVLEERYDRLDDGSRPEHARLKKAWLAVLEPWGRCLDRVAGRRWNPQGRQPRRGHGGLGSALRTPARRGGWKGLRSLQRLRLRQAGGLRKDYGRQEP